MRKLYRDPDRGTIAGVCAGIANSFGLETWKVRCVAVAGLFFIPGPVFVGYWVLYFIMDEPPLRRIWDARSRGER